MVVVTLTKGMSAMIDECDLPLVEDHSWCIQKGVYAATEIEGKTVYMHRLILDAPQGMSVDHINGDTLDNRRSNLRIVTHTQNSRNRTKVNKNNTSGYMGVSASRGKWYAQIMADGKNVYLGTFACPIEAAVARDVAAHELFGEHASYNFPEQMKAFEVMV